MAVTAVQRHDERHGRLPVPGLGDVEGEPAPRVALVRGVQHADAGVVVAQRRGTEPRDERVVGASGRVEKPAAHRLEDGRQRIERLLHPGEAAQGAEEADRLARAKRRVDERRDELEGLPRHVDEPVPHEVELVRPRRPLEGAQGSGQGGSTGGERLGEASREGRMQVPLHPAHALERLKERRQEPFEGVDHRGRRRRGTHATPGLTPRSAARRLRSRRSPRPAGRGSGRARP